MANIPIISNADQPTPGEPGGDTNTGTVEWLSNVFLNTSYGYGDASTLIVNQPIVDFQVLGERLIWLNTFQNPDSGWRATFNQAAYTITSNTTTGAALESQNLSVMAPWTMDFNDSQIWHSSQGTKLLISTDINSGPQPAGLVSIGINQQFIESSISKAQMIAGSGFNDSSDFWSNSITMGASPNGQHIILRVQSFRNGSASGYQLVKVNFDADHYLTGVTKLASPINPVDYNQLEGVVAASNTHVYTKRNTSSPLRWYLDKRDINTGIVVSSITNAEWISGVNVGFRGKVFGNSLYVFTTANDPAKKAKIWRINLLNDQVIKTWDVSAPPINPSFTPVSGGEPNTYGYNTLQGIDIDDTGIVYLRYQGDFIRGANYSWSSSSYPITYRIHRCKLS